MHEIKRREIREPKCGACHAKLYEGTLDGQFFIAANFAPNMRDLVNGVIIEQQRIGKGGKPFGIYKIKTMRDDIPASHFVTPNETPTDNPRIIGNRRILRRYWIDEIPQLVNVAKGDLKLIGPRALPLATAELLPKSFIQRRARIKPGLISISYADPHNSIDEMLRKERIYLFRHARAPLRTDLVYLMKFIYQVAIKGKRGQ